MISPAARWPVAIVAALTVTAGANGYLLYRATETAAPLESDYYRKAVAWDSTMAQARSNELLGWRVTASVAPDGRVVARIVDRAGHPILGATVHVEGFPIAHADGGITAVLLPTGLGYEGLVPLRYGSLHELRFEVAAGGERFTSMLRGSPGAPFSEKR